MQKNLLKIPCEDRVNIYRLLINGFLSNMNKHEDGRENVEDWFFLENLKRKNGNDSENSSDEHRQTEKDNTARKRTKDFIENELHAMSTLSLYDDSLDKMKLTGDADK